MIKKLTLGTLVLLAFVYSCKKDEETENPAKENVPLIATRAISYEEHSEIDSSYYFYDSERRYAGYKDNNNHRVDISYSGSGIIYKAYNNNVLVYTDNYTLNEQNMATLMVRTQPGRPSSSEKYFYNSKNQLTQLISIVDGVADTSFYSYDGDNLSQWIIPYTENSVVSHDTIRYEYYTDKISTVETANYGASFMGPQSKNLIKKTMRRYGTTDFTCEFDSNDRVIKETATSNGSVDHYVHYTYKD